MGYLIGAGPLDPAVKRYNGGTSSFTMDNSGTTNGTLLWVDGVAQVPGTDYNVSGTTITTTTAAGAGTNNVTSLQLFNTGLITTPADNTVAIAKIQDDAVTLAKMAAGTDGNLISYDTSGNPVAVATGDDGQVLTSSGAGAVCAFEDAAGGGWEEVSTTTASASATVEFTGLENGYDYRVEIIQSVPATDHKYFKALVGTGGTPTYLTSGYLATYASIYEGGTDYAGDAGTTHVFVSERQGSAASEELSGIINIYDPGSSAIHFIDAHTHFEDNNGNREITWGQTLNTGTTALTAIKFLYEAGNVASGVFKLLRIGRS